MLGHLHVHQDQRRSGSRRTRLDRLAAVADHGRRGGRAVSQQRTATRWLTGLSSASRMRSERPAASRARAAGGRRRRRAAGRAATRRMRHGEVEGAAAAGLALDPDRAAHQLDQLRGRWPGPGRCRRTGAWSSCRPARTARRSRAACRRDADAGVAHREAQLDRVARRLGARRATCTATPPASVNLMALPTRLTSTWRSRPGRRSRASGTPASTVARRAPAPFACARRPSSAQRLVRASAQVEVDRDRGRACRPRSWRSRGCR